MLLWRISEHRTLDGTGGKLWAGRWNSRGLPVAYIAESSALAMLEVLVNLELSRPPRGFQLLEIAAPDDVGMIEWPADDDHADMALTRRWGDAFLRANEVVLARVPSIVAPKSWNYLLNPLHPDASRVTVVAAAHWPWDVRLFARV